MNRLTKIALLALMTGAASFIIAFTTVTDSYAAKCTPGYKGGASGNDCPDDKDVPGYEGHTYHTINIRTKIEDPSNMYTGASTKSERIYCDCGRSTQKCRVSPSKPSTPGRTGSFVGSSSKTAGGANGKSSTVTFTYELDPIPAFQLTTTTTVDKPEVRSGDVATFTHIVNKVSGKFPSANDITWRALPSREGGYFPYTYKNALEQSTATLKRQQMDNRFPDSSSGKGYGGGTTKVTIQKDTPAGVKICYSTTVNPSNNTDGTYRGDKVCTTVARADYNLVPSTTIDNAGPAEPGEPIQVTYKVENTLGSVDDVSGNATWRTYGIKVNPGVDTAPITGGNPKESTTPEAMIQALGGQNNATLFDVGKLTGQRTFPSKATTTLNTDTYQLPADAASGSKYCFLLSVAPPTQNTTPDNRHSIASCAIVGKKPRVTIYGGDLSVGRRFINDTVAPRLLDSTIETSTTVVPGSNKTYGSWTEYDAYAPGAVKGFATASGLQGGATTSVNNQSLWSKLTFVNIRGQYGNFGGSNTLGTIPDTGEALVMKTQPVRDLTTADTLTLGPSDPSGKYTKATGNLTINASALGKKQGIVISVPNGTVTIGGNITYPAGGYGSIGELSQVVIVARSIIIQAPVTNVDAWLIAKTPSGANAAPLQSDTSGYGVIATCDRTTNLTVRDCNQKLTINGPVMANKLVLARTAGEINDGDAEPAEAINLRPDAYLWLYNQGKANARAITTYSRELGPRF